LGRVRPLKKNDKPEVQTLRLSVYLEDLLRRVLIIPETGISIGRGSGNDLQLEHVKVSRNHARLFFQHGRLWIEDCQSANGTLVGGVAIDRRELTQGDQIEIGPFRLALEDVSTQQAQVVEAATEQKEEEASLELQGPLANARELAVLLSLLESLDLQLPKEALLGRLLGGLLSALDAERAFLYRYDGRSHSPQRVHCHLVEGASADLPVSETLLQKVAREKKPVLITDLVGEGNNPLASLNRLAMSQVRSVIVSPLILGRKLTGILYVDSHSHRKCFLSRHLNLLSRTSGFLAGLIDTIEVKEELRAENYRLKGALPREGAADVPLDKLHHPSSPMVKVYSDVTRAAGRNVTVLIHGETGTGKEVVARAIHRLSDRSHSRFVAINCGAVPETLVESELFGYRKGAFSGANEDRPGLIELASSGTLFLDEVGELPLGAQAKLLRVLEERTVQRLGASDPKSVDFRLIAATHRSLDELVAAGAFRQDLMYRLNVFTIVLPPLRDRLMDLELLVDHLISGLSTVLGSPVKKASQEVIAALASYSWPGNVRELRNILERALVLEDSDQLSVLALPVEILRAQGSRGPQRKQEPTTEPIPAVRSDAEELRDFEAMYMRRLQQRVGRNVSAMAKVAGLSRLTLYRKLGQLGLQDFDQLTDDATDDLDTSPGIDRPTRK
jgi:transcriptional regulator with GAF, ATPase, and Fis domain